jgi:hypothetical protein
MKNLVLLLVMSLPVASFAQKKMTPIEDDKVSASLVYDVKSISSKDGVIGANLVTVFRGSAAGVSSVIVTFADSLEDNSFSFAFDRVLGAPTGVTLKKIANNSYQLTFNVKVSVYRDGLFTSKPEQINLLISKDQEGNYLVFEK